MGPVDPNPPLDLSRREPSTVGKSNGTKKCTDLANYSDGRRIIYTFQLITNFVYMYVAKINYRIYNIFIDSLLFLAGSL